MEEQVFGSSNLTVLLLIFSTILLLAVLVSGMLRRSILSTAILFLLAGGVIGFGFPDYIPSNPNPILFTIVQLALFGVLFTDGMRAGLGDLASTWRLPGRALLLGMPIAFLIMTGLAHFILNFSWTQSMLLAAVLSPTDPVLAKAIIGREEVPYRLRRLLNVESGVNDGLALPVVIVLFSILSAGPEAKVSNVAIELAIGIGLGIVIPWVAIEIGKFRLFYPASRYEPFYAFSIGLLLLSLGAILKGNLFLAAFLGGIMIATLSTGIRDSFSHFGEFVTELLKLFSLLLFGTLISPNTLLEVQLNGYVFAILVLLLVRPVSIGIALLGSGISRREWLAAA